jgi:regulator of replication initiation timing
MFFTIGLVISIIILLCLFIYSEDYYQGRIYFLIRLNKTLEIENKKLREVTNEEVIDAVRYAMKAAHPDNPNGNIEDFIKYRELYNKICEKKH